jgi:WD40 repeat protein
MVKRSRKNNKLKGGKPFVGKFCREISSLGHTDIVHSVAFHPSLNLLATCDRVSKAKLWSFDIDGSNPVCSDTANVDGHTNSVTSVAFHPSRNLLAIGSWDWSAKLCSFKDDGSNLVCKGTTPINFNGHTDSVTSVSFHPDGYFLATGSWDNRAKLWSLHPGINPVCTATTRNGHTGSVKSVAFHPSRNLLATGSSDKTAKLWSFKPDGSNLVCQDTANVNGHINWVNSVAFHSRGNLLATGSGDNTAKLWSFHPDGSNLKCISTLSGHTDRVVSVAFHPDDNFLATGSMDHTAKLWRFNPDGSNPVCIETLNGHTRMVKSVAFHPNGNLLATGSWDMTAKLWDCSKIREYQRRLALTHGKLATQLIRELTENPQLHGTWSKSTMRSKLHQQVGNVLEINTPASRANPDTMKAQKYLEFSSRESAHQELPPSSVIKTLLLPVVEEPGVTSFCAADDSFCISLYDSIPWTDLNDIPGDCYEASDLLDKLITLETLLKSSSMDEKDKKLTLTTRWIHLLRNKINQCRR